MATYSVETRNGSVINVPDYVSLHIDGLEIIGDQTTDWNEPYNKNFLTLDKKIMAVESLIEGAAGVDLMPINTDIATIKQEILNIKVDITSGVYDDTLIKSRLDILSNKVDTFALSISNKVDKLDGKQLSTEDYTSTEKAKLSLIEAGAQLNTVKSVAGKTGDIGLVIGDVVGLSEALIASGSNVDLSGVDGDILPTLSSTYNIGSATNRWKGIYVDEAYLSANTLYIDNIPVIGTDSENIVIKADIDQSITVQTKGLGVTNITSENEVSVSTSGTNADIVIQATGTNSKVKIAGANGIELSNPVSVQNDLAVSGNLTLTGNVVMSGAVFEVNATTVTTKDNIIVVNKGEIGTGVTSGKAGIQVDRGEAADYQLVFDESIDKFVVGQVGGTFETLASREYIADALSGVDSQINTNISTKQDKSITKVLNADMTLTTSILTPIPEFNINLQPNKVYQIIAYIPFIHSTSGAVCSVGYTAPIDAISFLEVITPLNTGNLAIYDYYSYMYSNNEVLPNAKAGYSLLTNGDNNPCIVKGILKTNSEGVFSIKVASEDGTAVVVKQNATLILIPN